MSTPTRLEAPEDRLEIYLLRHGETFENRAGVVQGQDPRRGRLNPRGLAQARAVGQALAHVAFDEALCSTLERAVLTLSAVLAERHDSATVPLRFEPDLREINMGVLHGAHRDDWIAQASAAPDPVRFAPEGGESWPDVQARVGRFFEQTLLPVRPGRVLMVAHGGVNRGIITHLLGLPMIAPARRDVVRQRNTCINRITLGLDGTVQRMHIDDTRHLAVFGPDAPADAGRVWQDGGWSPA